MRISDWSSDVCSSDLQRCAGAAPALGTDPAIVVDQGALDLGRDRVGWGGQSRPRGIDAGQVDVAEPRAHQIGPLEGGAVELGARQVGADRQPLGRATRRERVCQYGKISGVAYSLNKK